MTADGDHICAVLRVVLEGGGRVGLTGDYLRVEIRGESAQPSGIFSGMLAGNAEQLRIDAPLKMGRN